MRLSSKTIMSRALFTATFSFLAFVSVVRADDAIANAQQALKEQGFYYGEITGHKDADTTAAIRRYQIRNGLKVTGELNNETQRSLHVTGTTTAPQRVPAVPHQPMQDDSDLNENQPHTYEPPPPQSRAPQYGAPQYGASPIYPNEPYRYREEVYGIFSGTPYERASIGVQQRIVFNAQLILARRVTIEATSTESTGRERRSRCAHFKSSADCRPPGDLICRRWAHLD